MRGVPHDLHVAEGDLPMHRAEVIPGHEVVGEVVQVGSGVQMSMFAVGDPSVSRGCATPAGLVYCLRGQENLCPDLATPAGMPTVATPSSPWCQLIRARLPPGYADDELAPLLCAGIIGYRSLLAPSCPPAGGWASTVSAAVPI